MRRGFLYLLLLIGLMACSDKQEPDNPSSGTEVQFGFSLKVDPMGTRAGEDISNKITTLDVLVLEKEQEEPDTNYRYTYRTTAKKTDSGNDNYSVNLRLTDASVKLLLLANYTDFSGLVMESSIDEIRKIFLLPFTGEELTLLPMYGELTFAGGLIWEGSFREDHIPLLRSVAAVDIKTDASLSTKFLLKSVQAYRANNQIQIIPDPSAANVTEAEDEKVWKVTAPSVPTTAESNITTGDILMEIPDRIYLPESKNRDSGATCLIIGGIYRGDGYVGNNTVTYYRINFGNDNSQGTGQILRNHLYSFSITNVTGPGTTHPELSTEAEIETAITEWTGSDHDIEL